MYRFIIHPTPARFPFLLLPDDRLSEHLQEHGWSVEEVSVKVQAKAGSRTETRTQWFNENEDNR